MLKPPTLTNYRKSSASHLASKGVSQAQIEDYHGWIRGSKVLSRYVSVLSEETDREIAGAYGKDVEEDAEDVDISLIKCFRCDKETPRDKDPCVRCGQALEPGAAEVADELEEALVDAMTDAEDETERSAYKKAWREVRNNPEQRGEMVDDLADE